MSLSAPYRFVPLSKLVLLPDWAEQVSHDRPFEDGVSGELTIKLRCDTPLCVGGEQDPSSENEAGKVHFFRVPGGQDGQLAIPGTSLKGMLRNVLEIASFARFKQVEDQKLGVRDITQSKNFYFQKANPEEVQSGWLRYQSGKWEVLPCKFSRLHQLDLIKNLKTPLNHWKREKKAEGRYELIGVNTEIQFDRENMPAPSKQQRAIPKTTGQFSGRIVVTGQPGQPFDKEKMNPKTGKMENKNKKYEFVFHDSSEEPIEVTKGTMTGFKQIHSESDEWKFWNEQQAAGNLDLGIPVFFHKSDTGSIKSMGLAMMYKLPYENSLHDAIRHTLADHLDSKQPDLPDLIFGFLGDDQNEGLRGRVNIGMALSDKANVATTWKGPMILSSPKPTFYPAYIRQDGRGKQPRQLMEDNCELSGWKRYPTKKMDIQEIPDELKEKKKIQVELEIIPDGTEFSFKIRLHNLRRVELGALLWTLDFGSKFECRHGLGIGRPFGFGQVALSITGSKLRANDHSTVCHQQPDTYLTACRIEFEQLMENLLKKAGACWKESDPLIALAKFATPDAVRQLKYQELSNFKHWKSSNNIESVKNLMLTSPGLIPLASFKVGQVFPHDSRYKENIAQIAQLKDKEAQNLAKEAAKEAEYAKLNEEGKALFLMQEKLDQADSEKGKGRESTLFKHLEDFAEMAQTWTSEDKERARTLAMSVFKHLNLKKKSKSAEKILAKLKDA